MKKYLKVFFVSLCSIVIIAVVSIVYGLIKYSSFTLHYIFDANFFAGFILLVAGVVIMFLPSAIFTKDGNLLEQVTLIERSLDNREKKQQIARIILWLGLFIVVLTGLIQLLLSAVI